jgi:predicted O-methyltransferase YrrM
VPQDDLLSSLEEYADESDKFPVDRPPDWNKQPSYYHNNGSFASGDAEVLYAMIRHLKPRRIVEVGSGFSTLVMTAAARANAREGDDRPAITCIEPYEARWLSRVTDVELLRQPVDRVSSEVFESLGDGDLLFIDSSHVIRPGDDMWFVFFKLRPLLKKGAESTYYDFISRHRGDLK